MKILNSLLASLFAVLLIASCGDSLTSDTNEGTRIGTWMVYSDKADWVGTQSQSKAKGLNTHNIPDTVHYNQPDSMYMGLYQPPGWAPNGMGFHFVDSTYAYGEVSVRLANPLQYWVVAPDATPEVTEFVDFHTNGFEIECDSTYSSDEYITITYTNDDVIWGEPGYLEKILKIHTTGVVEAAKTLAGCTP